MSLKEVSENNLGVTDNGIYHKHNTTQHSHTHTHTHTHTHP